MERIPTPKISDYLKDLMEPLHISAYRLAKGIGVPVSRIQDLLHDRRKITVDTSIRISRFFNLGDDMLFLRLQNDIDYRNTLLLHKTEIDKIKPIVVSASNDAE